MQKNRKKAAKKPKPRSVWKSILLALPITLATGGVMLLLLTAVLLMTDDPIRYEAVGGLALLYITALLGGTVSARLCGRQSPLLCGMLTGGALMLILALPALFTPKTVSEFGGMHLLLRLPMLPLSLLTAFLTCRKKPQKRRR